MNIEYRLLKESDLEDLKIFCEAINMPPKRITWILEGIRYDPKNSVTAAEIVDNKINGILVAKTLNSAFFNNVEFLPIWVGIRADRLLSPTNFTIFMDNTSKLLTDLFESRKYFQHYIIIKLPRTAKTDEDIVNRTKKIWAQGPYHGVVECVIRSKEDFENAPVMFKKIMGDVYYYPSAVLFMNMGNEQRKIRLADLEKRNYKDPL